MNLYRSILLLLFITTPFSVHGLWNNNTIERTHHTIQMQTNSQEGSITIQSTLKNTTQEPQDITFFFPFSSDTSNIQIFDDFDAIPHTFLEGEERKNEIFNTYKEHKNYSTLRLFDSQFPKLLKSETIRFHAQEEKIIKIRFQQKMKTLNDFKSLHIFTNDNIQSKKFVAEIGINTQEPLQHVIPPLFNPEKENFHTEGYSGKWVYSDYISSENLSLLFSHTPNATIQSQGLWHSYTTSFMPAKKPEFPQHISIILDRSGSMKDGSWDRTIAWIRFLLDTLSPQTNIRIAFADESLQWYNEEFQLNSFSFKKSFFQLLSTTQPVGVMDSNTIFDSLDTQSLPQDHVFLFFSNDINPPSSTQNQTNKTLFPFYFRESETNDAELVAQKFNGFAFRLYRSTVAPIEKNQWISEWNNWHTSYDIQNHENRYPKITPNKSTQFQSYFSVERHELIENTSFINTINQTWAHAFLQEKIQSENVSESDTQDLYILMQTTGLQYPCADGITPYTLFAQHIKNQKSCFSQTTSSPLQTFRLQKSIYKHPNNRWQTFDYHTFSHFPKLTLAPYSQATDALLQFKPDIIAPYLSVSDEIDFCIPSVCISITKDGRTEKKAFDIAFFEEYPLSHWADPFIREALFEGIFFPTEAGELLIDDPMSRNDFSTILQRVLFPNQIPQKENIPFTDINPEDPLFQAMVLLFEKEILQGYSDNTLRPHNPLTRAEGVKILLASLSYTPSEEENNTPAQFEDSQGWEKPWINEASRRGLIQGRTPDQFDPHTPLTKAEALKIILEARN